MAPVIRDLGMTLAMRHDEEAVAMILRAQMGKAGPPMSGQGPPHRRLRAGACCPPPRRWRSARCRWPAWRWPSRSRAASASRCRSSAKAARRSASGTKRSTPAPRGEAAGDLLPAEQPDRALDAGARQLGRARVCRQGRRLRHSRPHHRRHRSRRSRRRVHVGRRARARGRGPGADRSDRDAHVRTRASRRHAVSRQGSAAVVGVSPAARERLCQSRALRVLGEARSDSDVRAPPRRRGRDRRRRISTR